MKAANDNKTVWNKAELKDFYAKHDDTRRESDKERLSQVFNLAAKSPALKEALDWAKAHDIEFVVDRKLFQMGAAGIYHSGTGILAVAEEVLAPENFEYAVGTLAHEIRHAWQDYNGLLPTEGDSFTGFYIRQSVLEAYAGAHGELARQQWKLNRVEDQFREAKKHGFGVSLTREKQLKQAQDELKNDPAPTLWQAFKGWFTSENAEGYGKMTMMNAAQAMGIGEAEELTRGDEMMVDAKAQPEFIPAHDTRHVAGVDIGSVKDLALLGQGFNDNGNYFNAAPAGYIDSNILNPSLAEKFYKAGAKPHPLVVAIREKEQRAERVMRGF